MRAFIAALLLFAAWPAHGGSHVIKDRAEVKRLCGYIDHSVCRVCRCGFAVGDRVWVGK